MPRNILTDAEFELTVYKSRKDYPENMRLVRYYDKVQTCVFIFLANVTGLNSPADCRLLQEPEADRAVLMVQEESQDQEALGITENAVRIQISANTTAYCLVAVVQHDMQLKRSTCEVLQTLSISLTDKTPLSVLFDKTYSHDVKEQSDSLFRGCLIRNRLFPFLTGH